MRRFVLLDRDGTINVDKLYLGDPEQLELIPGAAAALRRLKQLGFGVAVVTNQSGIGRGHLDEDQVERVMARLRALLAAEGVVLDGIYICPHAPDDGCDCRKPLTGLVRQAIATHDFDPAAGYMIGDKEADVQLGRAIGAVTFLVRTGFGTGEEARGVTADHIVDDLPAAVRLIEALEEERAQPRSSITADPAERFR